MLDKFSEQKFASVVPSSFFVIVTNEKHLRGVDIRKNLRQKKKTFSQKVKFKKINLNLKQISSISQTILLNTQSLQ